MKTALLVDDAMCVREVMEILVGSVGLKVVGKAENGRVGVEKYKELRPDIVFMDVMMEEMNGLEALRQILKFDPDAKVVITSSTVSQGFVADEAIELGAVALLPKPLDVKDVEEVMQKIANEKLGK
ncbi:MAG: response regulator [Oscillospiraceae bacterium]|nr:response regulator [Oscillospiraceae bacterium]